LLPQFKNTKLAYSLSLVIGAIGFVLVPYIHDQYLQFIPFLLIGCAWAAMLAMPFTFVTNALQGYGHMGAYLGLFNGTICVPQIIAALLGGIILSMIGSHQSSMMIVAGISFLIASLCVFVIKDKK
jgi:maltose/moltooligosaccharide transporter